MTHPGEQFYPEGVHWDDPIACGTVPGLLSKAAADFGARPAIEFRDRAISFAELEEMAEVAAGAFMRAGFGKSTSVALFLGNTPDHPVNFFGALKAGARIVHLSPLDGMRALSHKLSDSAEISGKGIARSPDRLRGRPLGRDRQPACADPGPPLDRDLRKVHRRRGKAGAMATDFA
jgi:non-ribosomal peptide synthetase component E (peptide arylation enzyme)